MGMSRKQPQAPKHPNPRMNPGGDLYRRPWSRAEMLAPLAWHEQQLAIVNRYGELEDGSIGWVRIDNRCSCSRAGASRCAWHPSGIGNSSSGDGMQD